MPKVYPSREAYAREVWSILKPSERQDILDDYGMSEADDEFFGYFTDNMDSRHNGAVTFTAVEGGVVVDDEADAWLRGDLA